MSLLIKYEQYGTNKILYECDDCYECQIEEKVDVCPKCGAVFTEFFDETEITHAHNKAIEAFQNNPNDEKLFDMLYETAAPRLAVEFFR